ncbi:PREDICTED: uncharacterized protein LOC105448015 [Wasmannia auropunctata]|uniref:uncharacterized protein LOC105448015 n=1 Tax=Wasmannia auropunctata TaxID=64793 RepID=UPI0005EDB5CD|nr:PREDICTED: uncharacterized protein LOC105448015 [Wasmannia auropunctata]
MTEERDLYVDKVNYGGLYRQRLRRKIITVILFHRQIKCVNEEHERSRRFWVRPILQTKRHENWEHLIQELRLYDTKTYFNFMRMTPETFEEILSLVGLQLMRQITHLREPIYAEVLLSFTIR